MTSAYFDKHTS